MTLYGNKPGRKTELSGGPAAYLNDQLHQGLHPPTAEGDQIQVGLPGRRQPAENAVPNNDQHHGQVDGADGRAARMAPIWPASTRTDSRIDLIPG